MSRVEIVVARYNENLNWVNHIKKDITKLIYNKGNDIFENYTKLENIGRESDTFLNHIIRNYNNLGEFTFFLQGDPFFHFRETINCINNFEYNKKNNLIFLSDKIVTDDINGLPNHGNLKIKNILEEIKIEFTLSENFTFAAGAQYCVNRDLILSKSLEWWIRTYEVHVEYLKEPGINGSPWIFERIWPKIFTHKEKNT